MTKTALLYCDEATLHDTGDNHPESPKRLAAIRRALQERRLNTAYVRPEPAAIEDLLRNHAQDHIDGYGRPALTARNTLTRTR